MGIDLVAMVVDDLVVSSAQPAVPAGRGRRGPQGTRADEQEVISSVAGRLHDGAFARLLGSEGAEHHQLMATDRCGVSATSVSIIKTDDVPEPDRVKPDD